MIAAVSLAMFIPSIPGHIGVYHLASVVTLSIYGISEADARAFSIVLHLVQYIPTTLIGWFFLKRTHLSLGAMRRADKEEVTS